MSRLRRSDAGLEDSTTAIIGVKATNYWVKYSDRPVDTLPSASECERYPTLRTMALIERETSPSEDCPHNLGILYGFWAHFLVRNFNQNMYEEFHSLALADHHERQVDVGLNELLKYYRDAFSNGTYPIRNIVAKDYVELARLDMGSNQDANHAADNNRRALRQLRSQWRDGATDMRNRKKLAAFLDDEIKAALEASDR